MPKRKADSDKSQGDDEDAKKPRTEGAVAATDHEAALAHPDLASRMAVHTLELSDAVNATGGSYTQRMQTVVDLLKEDASRPRPLIDLTLVVEGQSLVDAIKPTSGSFAQRMKAVIDLLQVDADRSESLIDLSLVPEGDEMLQFCWECMPSCDDGDDVKVDRGAAEALIINKVPPLMPVLLRSFDPATVDVATGNNALHQTCRLFTLHIVDDWPYKLTELLIAHGVSVHARNKEGRTPLLQRAATSSHEETNASGLRLLLAHGADLNAQDGDGNGLLHWLVENKAADLLDDLLSSYGVDCLNLTLRNSAGQTAAELAAFRLAEKSCSADGLEWRIHRLLATQMAIWIKHAQPTSLRCLQAAMQPVGAAAVADNRDSLDDDLVRARLVPRIALQTLTLVDAIKKNSGVFTQRMQTVTDLLKEDADQPESLIDLSLVPQGDEVSRRMRTGGTDAPCQRAFICIQNPSVYFRWALCSNCSFQSCVLFQMLKFFYDCIPDGDDAADVKADKIAAEVLIDNKVTHLMSLLFRSFDPATVDVATGNNALHVLCALFSLDTESDWPCRLAELLIDCGVIVHARNKEGRTPLLQRAATSSNKETSARGLRLLVAQGTDLNAQDGDGNCLLHLLVQRKAAGLLGDLSGDEAGNLDHVLQNAKGQSAADLAAIQLAQQADSSADGLSKRIHRLMTAQAAMWTERVRPALLLCLESALSVTDLAKLALGYVDGSGLPFATAVEEAEGDEATEPAAAPAAAVQS